MSPAVVIDVQVTPADIVAGRADRHGGPLAPALARLGYADVGVGTGEVLLRRPGGGWLYAALPGPAAALVAAADADQPVRPLRFDLWARALLDLG